MTALEARADDNLKLAHVQQTLIHEELKITENFGQAANTLPGEQTTSAMVSSQGNHKSWKPRCYMCGQLGHFRCDCPNRKEHNNPGTDHKARTAEVKCHKSKTAEDYSDNEMMESVEAFTASVDSTCQMDKWLVDSGASSHMTWERNILTIVGSRSLCGP